jgi:hypothetical protein
LGKFRYRSVHRHLGAVSKTVLSFLMMTTIGGWNRSGDAACSFLGQFMTRNATAAPIMPSTVIHRFQLQVRGLSITQLGGRLFERR